MSAANGGGSGGSAVPEAGTGAAPPAGIVVRESSFERGPGLALYCCDFLPAAPVPGAGAAALVLMHGYAEHCRRYDELAAYLARRGHAVSCFDARGHGRSPGQRGHVREYREYVEDFAAFVARVHARARERPLFALGHSNGGLIALRAVQGGSLPLRGLILTAPLLRLRASRRPVPDALARVLAGLLPRLPLPNGIHAEDLSHDPALRAAHDQDRRVHRVATPRWYWSSTLAGRAALEQAERVRLPLLLVQGELDPMVDPASVAELHARAASADKELVMRPGELHEVLNETRRLELFERIAAWIERRAVD